MNSSRVFQNRLTRIFVFAVSVALAISVVAQDDKEEKNAVTAKDEARAKSEQLQRRAEELIKQLGSDDFATRDQAEEELQKIAKLVRSVLDKAIETGDPEVAWRVRGIIDSIPVPDHTIVDALGIPIPFAKVTLDIVYVETPPFDEISRRIEKPVEKRLRVETLSDDKGGIAIGDYERADVKIVVESEEYGNAKLNRALRRFDKDIRLPLVNQDSNAFKRAVKGKVVNAKGKPIVGAEITCSDVRTPGEGLIQAKYDTGIALTDEKGEFAFYLPARRDKRRGELIPENSNFRLTAAIPDSSSVVPSTAVCNNSRTATLVIDTGSMLRRFEFETLDGKQPSEQELVSQFVIRHQARKDGNLVSTKLDSKAAVSGARLILGKYTAYRFQNGKSMNYLPIEVTEASHELLTFKLPPPLVYRGRLVNGVTGKPIEGGFVIGYSSTKSGSLADLTDEDWKALRIAKSKTSPESDKLSSIQEVYGVDGFVRSNPDGTFKIVQSPDREFYGLIAFDEGMIPFAIPGFYLKDKVTGKLYQRDYSLFPAAKLILNPINEGNRGSVWPEYIFDESEKQDQPEWFGNIESSEEETHGKLKYQHWMKANEIQPLLIPAGVKVRVRFKMSDRAGFAPFVMAESVELKRGESHELGEIRFEKRLAATVHVVDKDGNPVEGVPVRRMQNDERAWSVAHNTDANGESYFGLNPNSTGKFRAGESHGKGRVAPEIIEFTVKDVAPADRYEIKLSDEKINAILQRITD